MPGGVNQQLRPFLWRAANLYPDAEIVSRTLAGVERYTYEEYSDRTAQLAHALDERKIADGERIGTFCWNHHRHFETYFGVPTTGRQLHTINPLLPAEHLRYILADAEDRLLFVDPSLVDDLREAYDEDAFESVETVVVTGSTVPDLEVEAIGYESFIRGHSSTYDWPDLDEDCRAGLCYTSGTTGEPKGVEYTQQMLWSHTMASLTPQGLGINDDDVVMPVVPMFHVNAWGMPFTATAAGAKQVYPGPSPDPEDVAALIDSEEVTITAGVPTVWIGLQEHIEAGNDVDLSSLRSLIIGGSAAPPALIEWFEKRGVPVDHGWGMTEMSPIGTVSRLKGDLSNTLTEEEQLEKRAKQGLTLPGLEFKVVEEDGSEIPWNGEDLGELYVRGPWVTREYYDRPEATEESFEDGWLKTGDVVSVDEDGYIEIVDRSKDVIKSGGEWISSVEIENVIMAHEMVREAAVVGVPHDRWQERPVAFVVPTGGIDLDTLEPELESKITDVYPRWWLPEVFLELETLPKTATGKFSKKTLREVYADDSLLNDEKTYDGKIDDPGTQ